MGSLTAYFFYHIQGGQAEIEEDTSQGSLKEKYAPAGALLLGSPSGSVGIHSSLAEEGDDGDQEVNEDDAMVRSIGLLPLGTLDDGSQKSHLGYDTTFPYSGDYKTHRHPSHSSNYEAAVRKRSLGGRSYSFDDGSDAEEFQRVQRFAGQNTRPMYFDQNGASATPVESDISASPAGVHQKLMSLRNQYGNKWLNFVGPYAYRKRQILYRQCFFNPISCF